MNDDYIDDFEDFGGDSTPKVSDNPVGRRANPITKYQPASLNQQRPRVNAVQKQDSDDEYGDDFEEINKPSYGASSNIKPVASGSKPDWLKNNNSTALASKPVIGEGSSNVKSNDISTKPFINNANSRKAAAMSENREPRKNQHQPNTKATNDYTLASKPPRASKTNKKRRDFSVGDAPKPKKINLPKDYLDKYAKNNPVRDLDKSLKSIKDNIKSLQAELTDTKNIQGDHKRQKALQRINKELRNELKKLSENSTVLCDELQKKHYKKKKTPRKLDGETELKIKDREIENADKQMSNLLTEYNHVKKRIEQVGDYNYAVDLKAKVVDNEHKIKENEKIIKEMEQDQKRRDTQMNRLVREEKTEKMRRVDYKHSKLTYLHEKINEMDTKIEQLRQVKEEQDEQEKQTKVKYEKMLLIGENYGITEKNIDNEEQIFRNKMLDEYEQLSRKEKFLRQEIESIEKQYKVEIKDKKKHIKE
jgi:hypothetical protein